MQNRSNILNCGAGEIVKWIYMLSMKFENDIEYREYLSCVEVAEPQILFNHRTSILNSFISTYNHWNKNRVLSYRHKFHPLQL